MNNYPSSIPIIKFVLDKLEIRTLSELCNKWHIAEDWFFYFNKMNGTRVPSLQEVRNYMKVR